MFRMINIFGVIKDFITNFEGKNSILRNWMGKINLLPGSG